MNNPTPINQLPNMGQPPGAPLGSPQSQPYNAPNDMNHGATNEELIEAIIDEKWNELIKDVNKILEWKNSTENRITRIEQSITDMRSEFDKLHQGVLGKIGEYDKHIMDVGVEIQAMEKVFAKVLPVFTQNVSELTRITDDLKNK
jgi:prefoldin subunit 5